MILSTKQFSVAPMMNWTDKHDRYFLRLIAPDIKLYTEMITAQAIIHGDRDYLLGFNQEEHPIALQIGGSQPHLLAEAAKIGEAFGYDEINLNVGCPSDRVQSGRFGACLMLEPELVAECIAAMQKAVMIPVTVKCRIGVDDQDDYASLHHFITTIAATGCETFIIHARKAWLKGLSPKQNRDIPPLQYEVVHRIKKEFPNLTIILNGGLNSVNLIQNQLAHVDGVMIGRSAYQTPYFLSALQTHFMGTYPASRQNIIEKYLAYIQMQLDKGVKLSNMTRHILGLFHGQPGAATWRRCLSQPMHLTGIAVVEHALKMMNQNN